MNRNQKIKKIIRLNLRSRTFRRGATLGVLAIFIFSLFVLLYKPRAHAQIFLTSGTTWTVPSDWTSSDNIIEVIGGGGGAGSGYSDSSGSGGEGGGAGGGGAYSQVTNITLQPGTVVTVAIGGGGNGGTATSPGLPGNSGGIGGDTYLCSSTANCTSITDSGVIVGAKGGTGGAPGAPSVVGAGGSGGAAASGVGAVRYNGGNGGNGGPTASAAGGGGGGGGGAAGLTAAGISGTNGGVSTNTVFGPGGQGDGTTGGAGGSTNGAVGSNGTEYGPTHGSGGGGAGGNGIGSGSGTSGGNGGSYGAGGGAGGGNGSKHGTGGSGGSGIQGLIRISYSYASLSDYRWRLDDGNETSGSSLAPQDTAATITYGTTVRLRLLITNSGSSTNYTYILEYAPYTKGCYNWTTVPATPTTEAFNMATTSNYTDQAASTNASSGPGVITDPSGFSFTAGVLVSNPDNTATVALTGGQFTELEYAVQANSNATGNAYCFRVTNNGTPLDNYANYPILNINYPPSAPTIYSVTDGSTNTSRLPIFQLRSYDYNQDYLKYVVEVCKSNSWPCTNGAITYNESSACWSGQNTQSSTAYTSTNAETTSTMAYCQLQTADILSPSTTYYMRAKAIDPGGSNTYSAYSSVVSFTTGSLDIKITGGASITGGTKIGN